jgi:hypothetical protein
MKPKKIVYFSRFLLSQSEAAAKKLRFFSLFPLEWKANRQECKIEAFTLATHAPSCHSKRAATFAIRSCSISLKFDELMSKVDQVVPRKKECSLEKSQRRKDTREHKRACGTSATVPLRYLRLLRSPSIHRAPFIHIHSSDGCVRVVWKARERWESVWKRRELSRVLRANSCGSKSHTYTAQQHHARISMSLSHTQSRAKNSRGGKSTERSRLWRARMDECKTDLDSYSSLSQHRVEADEK